MSKKPITEQDSKYSHLEKMDTLELLQNINREDKLVAEAVENVLPQIHAVVDCVVDRLNAGGRILYVGAGTSGRLGVVDASECPPTFGVPHGLVIGLIAGGDGELLIFTSRRSDTKGGEIDEGSDYKFYEDIYYSKWNKEKQEWSKSIGAEGLVNTNTYDAVLSISPSGDQMFVYKNNKNSAGDIFVSKYNYHEEEWKACEKMDRPINTSYFESSVSITSDGNTLYFISERPEGNGQGDIYKSEKKSGGGWSSPKNLGKIINTPYDEKFVFVHPNGKTLFFASDGHQTMGSYDIFKTEFVNGQWSLPINLGYPINTVNQESTFSLTRDNKTLLIAAHYDDTFGERDIYKIDVSNYSLLSSGYESSGYGTVITSVSDADGNLQKGVEIKFLYASTGRIVTEGVTDKLGRVRINLPGNTKYKMQVVKKKEILKEELFDLTLDSHGETVKKFDLKLD